MSRSTSGDYNLYATHLFLTYPQCPATKESVKEQLEILLDNYDGSVIASERHQDGTPHLHAYVRLSKRSHFRNARFADITWQGIEYHGNYQTARSPRCVVQYVEKGGDFIADGVDLNTVIGNTRKSKSSSALIATKIRAGATLKELMVDPLTEGFLVSHLSRVETYKRTWEAMEAGSIPKLPLDRMKFLTILSAERARVARWVTMNLLSPPTTGRTFRSKQLYLWGPTGVGKTSFCLELEKYFKVYWAAYSKDFLDGYNDDYDLVVFEEFCGQKTVTWLNQFLQGTPMTINIKNSFVTKRKNIACIILSNQSPRFVFHHVDDSVVDAFISRLKVVEFRQFENMFQ
nr:rep protein [Cressdnaviricota sp.]